MCLSMLCPTPLPHTGLAMSDLVGDLINESYYVNDINTNPIPSPVRGGVEHNVNIDSLGAYTVKSVYKESFYKE